MRLVVFGVSNVLGYIFDCAIALKLEPSLIVMNMPEVVRPRTKSVRDRIALLPKPPRIIELDEFVPQKGECYCLGTTSSRRSQLVDEIRARFGITWTTLVHPAARVSPFCMLGEGVFVDANTDIGPGVKLGEHVFVGPKVHVGHDTIVEPYARLRSGCNVAGQSHVRYGATIGLGATVIEEIEIGAEAFVAAGAVVIRDVPAAALVAGVPAKIKKSHHATHA